MLYYYIAMEVVTMFFYSSQHRTMYIILCLISLCASICFCTVVAIGIWTHQLFQGAALTTIIAALYGALKGAILTTVLDGMLNQVE